MDTSVSTVLRQIFEGLMKHTQIIHTKGRECGRASVESRAQGKPLGRGQEEFPAG
jgi:hypothetical protein